MNTKAQGRASALADMCCPRTRAAERDEAWTLRAVARAKQSDRHAIRYLYSRYSESVRRYAVSLLRDADAADDVVQTTFLKLLTKIDRYEPRDVPFEAWLLRVARNVALDEMRRRRSNPSTPMLDHDAPLVDGGMDRLGALRTALDRIPPAQREVLVLRHLIGLSSAEVAERLDTTEAVVHALHHKGRANLRVALRQTGSDLRTDAQAGDEMDDHLRRMRSAGHRPVVEAMN